MRNSLRKTVVVGILTLFMVTVALPTFGGENHEIPPGGNNGEADFESYEILIYHFHGRSVTKTIKNVPYETAMKIKGEYDQVEKTYGDSLDASQKKQDILKKYGLFAQDWNTGEIPKDSGAFSRLQKLIENKMSLPSQGKFLLLGLFGSVNGEFYGQTINFLNLRFAGFPLVIFGKGGCEVRLTDLVYLGQPQYLATDAGYLYFSLFFLGQITIAPFLDPDGGQIMGITFLTLVLGGK